MSRFLFVVPPLAGHTYPTVGLGRELAERGHEVAWTGHASIVGALLADDARLIPMGRAATDETVRSLYRRAQGLRGAAAFQFLWQEVLVPLATSMTSGVETAVQEFEPDVLVVDQQALAGALVARRRGLAWATSATTPSELTPFALMPKLKEWVERRLNELQRELGVPEADARRGDLRFSDQLVLVFTTEALMGSVERFPDHYVFVGPSMGVRSQRVEFPWDWLDPARRCVLVTLGTVSHAAGGRFMATAVEALAPLGDRVQAILVTPGGVVDSPPDHVLVREFVPQLDLLPRVDAVVCHAGHNTVCESLAHGVPLAVAPIRDDQPIVAQQVADAGAGIRMRFGRVRADELRHAVIALLDDPSYRASARRVQGSFAAAGGAAVAAEHLEGLA